MKRLLPIVLVLTAFTSYSQIINFPDVNFKNTLLNYSPAIDLNGDHEIQVSEAAAMTGTLVVDFHNISDVTGVKYFTQIDGLSVFNNNLTTLDLSGMTNIRQLVGSMNPLTSINLSGMTSLQAISCILTSLASVDLTGLTMLEQIDLSNNNLTTLNIPALPNLTSLNCGYNQLTSLNISGLNLLNSIRCENNNLTSLNISNCPNLQYIFANLNQLQSLDLTHGTTALTFVTANYNNLNSIDLTGLINLQQAYFNGNQLTTLDLPELPSLTNFTASENLLMTVDVSKCRMLQGTNFINNQLTYINIKNGPTVISDPGISGNPVQYVCTDDAEVASLLAFLPTQGLFNVNINSYCSFTPGGSYNTISGTIRIDMNANGCDASDPIAAGMSVKTSNGSSIAYTSTNPSGTYASYGSSGTYTITAQPENPYFTITPASATINFPNSNNNLSTADFCLTPNGVHNDIEISIVPTGPARPGFDAYYQLIYKNKGSSVLSGNVTLKYNNGRINLIYSAPAVTTQAADSLTWSYTNIQPLETRSINIIFNLLPPPVNNNGETLNFAADITPLAGDETPRDNNFLLKQTITGSFDPNDKTCLEGDTIDITTVGDYVHYLVRFQNTGTEAAENVVVKDILQPNLDWNSFELIKTSHACVTRKTNNILEFIFEGINLPASTVNEPGSHGFISFKIKTNNSLSIGDSVKNTAAIYFDYNLPVITNVAGSVVGETHTIPISMEYFRGSRQSNKHYLTWKASCTSIQAKFDIERSNDGRNYQSIGNIIASNTRCLQPFDFTDVNPLSGINYYRIKMTDVDGRLTYSTIVALLNKQSGFEIVSLVPNPVVGAKAWLNITSTDKQTINILVTDVSGKTVQSSTQQVIAGFAQVDMNFSKLAAGVYTIIVTTADGTRNSKQFIRQ